MIVLFLSTAFAGDPALANTSTEEYDAKPGIVYVPQPRPLDTTPLVIKEGCRTYVYDPAENYQLIPSLVASSAGGYTDPVREAELMQQLRNNWPALGYTITSSDGWKMVAGGGNRLYALKAENGDLLRFEPRGSEFVEVYAENTCGNSISYTRQEALVVATETLRLPVYPTKRIRDEGETEAAWPLPTAAPTPTATLTPVPVPRRR